MQRAGDIAAIATGWLIRLEREATPELWEELQQWLDCNPRHRAEFIRQRTAWNRCDTLKMLRPMDGSIDADLLTKIEFVEPEEEYGPEPLADAPVAPATRNGLHGIDLSRRAWLAAAAVAGLAVLGAGYYALRADWESYQTAIGGRQQIALSDGSTVDLNTDSEMRVRISGARRDIVLKRGEALFHVAHDTRRPFFVTAETTVVRAVGTAFTVRIREDSRVEVLVTEGRVAVGTPTGGTDQTVLSSSATALSIGEAAAVNRGRVSVKRLYADEIGRKLAWTGGHLSFQGEPLREAVSEVNRYSVRRLAIADPSIVDRAVGGNFRLPLEPDSFVGAVEHAFHVIAIPTADGDELRLIAAPEPPDDTSSASEEPAGVSSSHAATRAQDRLP